MIYDIYSKGYWSLWVPLNPSNLSAFQNPPPSTLLMEPLWSLVVGI